MKKRRKFDIKVIVSPIKDTNTYNFTLQLESVFEDSVLPEYYKHLPEGTLLTEGDAKYAHLEMILNFLKNNLENS